MLHVMGPARSAMDILYTPVASATHAMQGASCCVPDAPAVLRNDGAVMLTQDLVLPDLAAGGRRPREGRGAVVRAQQARRARRAAGPPRGAGRRVLQPRHAGALDKALP